MVKNLYFVINDNEDMFELWVDGKCITNCFSLTANSGEADLMKQLVEFAYVPCYKKLNSEEIYKILLDN